MQTDLPADLIPLNFAAALLGTHRQTVLRWIMQGNLPGWKIGHRWRVSRRDVMDKIEPHDAVAYNAELAATRPLTKREIEALDADTDRKLRAIGVRK